MSTQSSSLDRKSHYPEDWPGEGPIDLNIHDLPHASSSTEWWYVNSHFKLVNGKEFSLFTSFFRKFIDIDKEKKESRYAHSITWAISDLKDEKYYLTSLIDRSAPKIGLEEIKKGNIIKDPLLRRAAIELLEKGRVPYPDRLFNGDVEVDTNSLNLDFQGNKLIKLKDKTYKLDLIDDERDIVCDLTFTLKKPPIRHGDNGVVRGITGEDMFYYFIPRCEITGTITMNGEKVAIENGSAWYDHEFGKHYSDSDTQEIQRDEISWNWISTQLSNGWEISAYDLFNDSKDYESCGHHLIAVDPEGNQYSLEEFDFTPHNKWTSMRTFNDYPTKWTLDIPGIELSVEVEAAFEQQEFMTVISKPAFWEGRINVKGTMKGEAVTGPGFIERSGFIEHDGMNDFFKAVGRKTRESIEKILPFEPNEEQAAHLVSSKDEPWFLDGLSLDQLSWTIIRPIREIIDRGGKAWRSYMPLACCDVVGGNSQEAEPWLALPELLHVGSLIVDDVEDKSDVRRGGPACHHIYGEAIAINAGTACAFIGQDFIYKSDVPENDKLEIYNLYFKASRAAHAGQAIDIDGFAKEMPEIVESGDGNLIEARVLAIHRLKAAVPASFLGQMGVILGKGTKEQSLSIGSYLEAVGMAFQIIDDVLNLRGFKDNLKERGEDIAHGKVTMPVAKAMNLLNLQEREDMWEIVGAMTKDREKIDKVINKLEECGAMDMCVKQSTDLVEESWAKSEELFRDSYAKLMLRAFGWFVLEREY